MARARSSLVWVVPAVAVVIGGAGVGVAWRLVRGAHGPAAEPAPAPLEATAAGTAPTVKAAVNAGAAAAAPDPMSFVAARAARADLQALGELSQAYVAWAGRADAQEARKAAAAAMVGRADVRAGIEALMNAVAADPTPAARDPMWRDLVRVVAGALDSRTFATGRDLVVLEERTKPHDLLLESLTEIPDKLTTGERPLLAADLIDMYPSLRPDQRPAVDKALRALAGNDVVTILAGRGVSEGSTELELAAEKRRAVEFARAHPFPDKPPEE